MNMALLDALRLVLISGFFSLILWIAVYTALAPWWRNLVGRTLVIKSGLIALIFVPSILSTFFQLSVHTSVLVGWIDVGLIGLVTPVMIWRTIVWVKLYRQRELPENDDHPQKKEEELCLGSLRSLRLLFPWYSMLGISVIPRGRGRCSC